MEDQRIWLKSVIIPSALILLLFVAVGWWAIISLRSFYYEQRVEEALLTAKSYATTMSMVIEADKHFDEELAATLQVGAAVVDRYPWPITNELLQGIAKDVMLDIIYLYDENLVVTHSSNGSFIGWEPPPDHPLRTFQQSGEQVFIDEIRAEVDTGILYKYAYRRTADGKIIQGGLKAEKIEGRFGHLKPQHIIEVLAQHTPMTRLALLDKDGQVIAASNISNIGCIVDPVVYDFPISDQNYRLLRMDNDPSLGLHLPLELEDKSIGSLIVISSLKRLNMLIHTISVVITLTLLVFYGFFFYSFSRVYRLNIRIAHHANHDVLTGLPNLRHYYQIASRLRGKEHALMVINPLNFKRLNMLFGYAHGDEVLTHLAHALQEIADHNEGITAFRLSDDRFFLLVTKGADHWNLMSLATAILKQGMAVGLLSNPPVTIGISQRKKDSIIVGQLLKEALIALDTTSTSNPIQFFNVSLESQMVRSNAIEELLRRAIDGEEGLLSVKFQPIYACDTKRVVSFEALARLEDPQLGSIAPNEFISIAERQQLIVPLGKKILPMALQLVDRLNQRGIFGCRVAINISALQLMDDSFATFVSDQLAKRHIHPSRIEFELTESSFADDHLLPRRLTELRNLGIRLSIDDFGTGYSSLDRLRQLQFDTIKLGNTFTQQIKNEYSQQFITAIVAMAHHIGKRVVAEGVETEEQRVYLKEINCDLIQGYLLSKPLDLLEALQLCKEANGDA
jgi:EAL domain-containing protein (putative c-di-GMP-specific phosphodiesterase class I)/GGDEF domain-containing protein